MEQLRKDGRAGVRALVRRWQRERAARAREAARLERLLEHERPLWALGLERIAGVDEAGAGPLAGPVVAAAVILPPGLVIEGVDDSKKLSRKRRAELAVEIRERALAWATGACEPEEIDRINIYEASREAMRRAVLELEVAPDHLLVDARLVPGVRMPQTPLIGGDGRSHSIAAASILAKVERDAIMDRLAELYPAYGFEQNRGYGTAAHLAALARWGGCPVHRKSYEPVRKLALRGRGQAASPMRKSSQSPTGS